MAATLGVATFGYAPYAVFCWLSPLVTIAFAFLGLRMPRLQDAAPAAGKEAITL